MTCCSFVLAKTLTGLAGPRYLFVRGRCIASSLLPPRNGCSRVIFIAPGARRPADAASFFLSPLVWIQYRKVILHGFDLISTILKMVVSGPSVIRWLPKLAGEWMGLRYFACGLLL